MANANIAGQKVAPVDRKRPTNSTKGTSVLPWNLRRQKKVKKPKKPRGKRTLIGEKFLPCNRGKDLLFERDIAKLVRAVNMARISVFYLNKHDLSPFEVVVLCLMRAMRDTVPRAVFANAPWITPAEAVRALELMTYIPRSPKTDTYRVRIQSAMRKFLAAGWLEQTKMEGEPRAKPYRMPMIGGAENFFEPYLAEGRKRN
jgi:hypothetical protein